MEDVLDEVVSSEDLQKLEKVFHEQLHGGRVTHKAQFEYAWCLVRSRYPTDIKKVGYSTVKRAVQLTSRWQARLPVLHGHWTRSHQGVQQGTALCQSLPRNRTCQPTSLSFRAPDKQAYGEGRPDWHGSGGRRRDRRRRAGRARAGARLRKETLIECRSRRSLPPREAQQESTAVQTPQSHPYNSPTNTQTAFKRICFYGDVV